jgi:cytochrome c-type biogenesis protein CcsB
VEQLSDKVFLTLTVMSYLAAMLVHAAEYAFGRQSHVARAAVRDNARELVGAGGPPVTSDLAADLDKMTQQVELPAKPHWLLRSAIAITWLAFLSHAATVVLRSLAAGRMPWGNMYEYVMTGTLVGTAVWLVIATRKPSVRHLGLFITFIQVMLTGIAGMLLFKPIGPLVPALDSYWYVVHVGTIILATGLLLVGFAASAMYLLRSGYDAGKRGGLYPYGRLLADAAAVERLSFRLHALAFPIWTFAVAAGAIWAEAAWGRYWGWDPKETWAFISWIVYACYLHARATPSISRRATAWIAVAGWATMMMNLFGVNIFMSGLHSYGGV